MAPPPTANATRLGGATTHRARAGVAPGDKHPIAVRNAMGWWGHHEVHGRPLAHGRQRVRADIHRASARWPLQWLITAISQYNHDITLYSHHGGSVGRTVVWPSFEFRLVSLKTQTRRVWTLRPRPLGPGFVPSFLGPISAI
jgi:hypothetical protein